MERIAARLSFPVALAIAVLLLLPICDRLHLCGCRAPWAGSAAACNVHAATGPHCPWCEHPALGALAALVTGFGQWGVFRRGCRAGASSPAAAGASLAALPAVVVLAGALAWLPTDYPHFVVPQARARLGLPPGPIACGERPGRSAAARCCAPRQAGLPKTAQHGGR